MRIVIQRVSHASVEVDSKVVGSIGKGLLVFLGVHKEDTEKHIPWLVEKLINLRIFSDENDKMNLSLVDSKGAALIVSQFTLYGNCKEGRRPDFFESAPPSIAEPLYELFVKEVRRSIEKVETGIFGAKMKVSLANDGPVTFIIDSKK